MNLKTLRKNAGLTQQEVAEKCGVTLRSYQNYEGEIREMNYSTLIRLAKIFNCSIDYLLGHESPQVITGNTPLQKKLIYQISQLDNDLCEIAEATIEGLYVTNQERRIMRERVQTMQKRGVAENDV